MDRSKPPESPGCDFAFLSLIRRKLSACIEYIKGALFFKYRFDRAHWIMDNRSMNRYEIA
ncbi:MAG: hypothetical protein HPY66_1010 [Firmicutes bacterium]|nr:hypothetical protein [Bacillota bacterium]